MTGLVPLSIAMPDGRPLTVEVAVGEDRPARFAMGVRKSGSSVFASIATDLARRNGWNVVDVADRAFTAGYNGGEWNPNRRLRGLVWRGNAYAGFREPPAVLFGDPVFREARKLLLVRDPRDALVSEYFSNAFSHRLPFHGGGPVATERARALAAGLEAYAEARAGVFDRTMCAYAALLGDPELLIQRYEDVIGDKPAWIRAIAAHMGWAADDAAVAEIAGWADVVPAEEDPRAFIRRVRPGDHREKMSAAAVAAVTRQLSGLWRDLGYDLSA